MCIPVVVCTRHSPVAHAVPPPQPEGRQLVPASGGCGGVGTYHCGYARFPATATSHPELAVARPRGLLQRGLSTVGNGTRRALSKCTETVGGGSLERARTCSSAPDRRCQALRQKKTSQPSFRPLGAVVSRPQRVRSSAVTEHRLSIVSGGLLRVSGTAGVRLLVRAQAHERVFPPSPAAAGPL